MLLKMIVSMNKAFIRMNMRVREIIPFQCRKAAKLLYIHVVIRRNNCILLTNNEYAITVQIVHSIQQGENTGSHMIIL